MSTYSGTATQSFFSGSTYYSGRLAIGQYSGNVDNAWLLLTGVTIPQGVTVSAATVTFAYSGTHDGSLAAIKGILYGAAADTTASGPTTFSAYTAGTRTSSSTAFVPNGSATQAVDATGIVQEVVSRSGWASGNNLLIYVQDNGSTNYNDVVFDSATLAVTYAASGTAATASGSLTLSGTAAAEVAAVVSASLALSGAVTVAVPAAASGSLVLSGTATAAAAFTCTAVVVGSNVNLSWPAAGASYAIERDGAPLAFGYVGTSYVDTPGAGSHSYRVGVLA